MIEDRSTLSVLESLSKSSDLPQRGIAADTGMNLAKVNFVLRELEGKDLVKRERAGNQPHRLKYLYILTNAGREEKSRIAYRNLQRTLADYNRSERRVADSLNSMVTKGVRRVVLWGNTNITDLVLRLITENGRRITVVGIVDPTGRHPRTIDVSILPALNLDAVVICQAGANGVPEGIELWRLV